jgi:hypothetical protein
MTTGKPEVNRVVARRLGAIEVAREVCLVPRERLAALPTRKVAHFETISKLSSFRYEVSKGLTALGARTGKCEQ